MIKFFLSAFILVSASTALAQDLTLDFARVADLKCGEFSQTAGASVSYKNASLSLLDGRLTISYTVDAQGANEARETFMTTTGQGPIFEGTILNLSGPIGNATIYFKMLDNDGMQMSPTQAIVTIDGQSVNCK